MFGPKIKVRASLLEKLKQAAQMMGCASVEEYVDKILEAEANKVLSGSGKVSDETLQDITHKLKGLGYLE